MFEFVAIEFDLDWPFAHNLLMDNEFALNNSTISGSIPAAVPSPVLSKNADEMRKIREEQDRSREELRRRIGTVNIAVDLIRSIRDE